MKIKKNISTGIRSESIELLTAELEILATVNHRISETLKEINFNDEKSIYYSYKELPFSKKTKILEDIKLLSKFIHKLTPDIVLNEDLFNGLFGDDKGVKTTK
jgi:hypothetical protein